MTAWMVYAAVVGVMVSMGGLALERLAAAAAYPRRIAWLAALALAVVIPLTGGWHRPATEPVVEMAAPEPAAGGGVVVGELWSAIPVLTAPRGPATGRIATVAWGAGSLACLAVLAGVLVLVARGRRRWERRTMHGTEVYLSRGFGPALVGIARPEVVLPAWVLHLEPGAREAIIRHEVEHARARDHLVLLCGGLAVAAFPWSPAIWWMYRRLRAAVELDCDKRVLASGIGVADYGDVLLNAGCRSRGRWGFAPAMGQPESLLERRLKTMSEKRRKLNAGHTALLAAVAVGAVVVACDTPVPTEVREAFEEVAAEGAAQGVDAEGKDVIGRFLVAARPSGSDAALLPIFVDGVRIRSTEDLSATAGNSDGFPFVDPEDIVSIEVLKGSEATKLYGEEAAGGVIQVFTEEAEPVAELAAVPADGEFVVTETVTVMVEPELVAVPSVSEIVVTGRGATEGEVELHVEELVVTGQARVMTGQAMDWKKWLTGNAVSGTPPDWNPAIYVDGVRVDGGVPGLAGLSPGLVADRIDRIEVTGGVKARRLYGGGRSGVIRIFTKR